MGSAESLPYLNADPNTITVSGYSAGCFMAHELSIIYSDEIQGAVLACCWNYLDKATLASLTGDPNASSAKSVELID